MKTKDSKRSEGARTERRAVRDYLRREIAKGSEQKKLVLIPVLEWMLARMRRYKDREGGL